MEVLEVEVLVSRQQGRFGDGEQTRLSVGKGKGQSDHEVHKKIARRKDNE